MRDDDKSLQAQWEQLRKTFILLRDKILAELLEDLNKTIQGWKAIIKTVKELLNKKNTT